MERAGAGRGAPRLNKEVCMYTIPTSPAATAGADYQSLKSRMHQELLRVVDLARLPQMRREDAEPEIRTLLAGMLARESQSTPLSYFERECLIGDIVNELFGLGPLEALMRDNDISDILVNRSDQVHVERHGRLEATSVTCRD